MRKLKHSWHKYMSQYNMKLYRDCLDEKLKNKLWNKVEYHEKEIQRIAELLDISR